MCGSDTAVRTVDIRVLPSQKVIRVHLCGEHMGAINARVKVGRSAARRSGLDKLPVGKR